MKRIYMTPEVKVVVIRRRPRLLAGSVEGFANEVYDEGNEGDDYNDGKWSL